MEMAGAGFAGMHDRVIRQEAGEVTFDDELADPALRPGDDPIGCEEILAGGHLGVALGAPARRDGEQEQREGESVSPPEVREP